MARPYATAAFDLARAQDQLALWSDMLEFLAAVVSDPLMQAVISDPRIEQNDLAAFIVDLCGGRLNEHSSNYVHVLTTAGRLALLPDIAGLFEQKRASAEGITRVDVTGAYEVNPKYREQIAAIMRERLGGEVELQTSIDKDLIGGVIIRAGDLVIDASIRGRLRQAVTAMT